MHGAPGARPDPISQPERYPMSRTFTIPIELDSVYTDEARLFARDLGTLVSGNDHPFALSFQIRHDEYVADQETGSDTHVWWRNPDTDVITNIGIQDASVATKRTLGGAAFGIAHCKRVMEVADTWVNRIGSEDLGGVIYDVLCLRGGLLFLAEMPSMTMCESALDRGTALDQEAVDVTMRAVQDTATSNHEALAFARDVEIFVTHMVRESLPIMNKKPDERLVFEDDIWRAQAQWVRRAAHVQ